MQKKLLGLLLVTLFTVNVKAETIQLKPSHKIGQVGSEKFTIMDWNVEFLALDEKIRAGGKDELFVPLRNAIIEKLALKNEAIKQGLHNTAEYKATLRKAERDILTRMYFDRKMGKISEAQLKAEYKLFESEASKLQEVKARHILVKKRSEADKIIKAIKSGSIDFISIAKSKSTGPSAKNGGDLGWVRAGQMVPEFDKALFGLKDGEVSPRAVKTQFGWHIIKREKSRKQPVPAFKDVKQTILVRVRQKQAQKIIDKAIKSNKVIVFDEKGNVIK